MRSHNVASLRVAGALAVLACAFAACGGGVSTPTPLASATPGTDITAATSTFCVTPSTSAQVVNIPNTGGFTGSLNIGAAASAASSCDVNGAVASGTDATAPSGVTASSVRRIAATNPANGPIWSISLSNAYAGSVEVTGATLNTPPNLNFPDGTYYAVVTDGTLPPTVLQFTAKNGVLTLASTGLPMTILPGSTLTLYLYAHGVVPSDANLPTAAPSPAPSASASASPAPTASASPTASPSATPVPTPTPIASPTAVPTYSAVMSLSPAGCMAFGTAGGTQTYIASLTTTAPSGTQLYYVWSNPNAAGLTYSFPSTPVSIGMNLNNGVATTTNEVTITVPAFPPGSEPAGELTSFNVQAAYYDASEQTSHFFTNATAYALATVAEGITNCPM